MKRPQPLHPGDTIAIVAPSSAFRRDLFDAGVASLEALGYRVWYRQDLFDTCHYEAGSVERRVDELKEAFTRPGVKAILCARGGYGLMRLLPQLEASLPEFQPRIFVGYSDLTPLLALLADRLNLVSFHGPALLGLHKTDPASHERFWGLLTSRSGEVPPLGGNGTTVIRQGVARGRICGGNLCLMASLLGTPWAVETRGRILCLEEVGERPYRVDRMLQQLKLAGRLEGLAGVALGEFSDCREPTGPSRELHSIFEQYFGQLGVPVLSDLPFGHGRVNDVFPIGIEAELDASAGTLRFLEPALEPA